ncbi:MAG TPA: peptide deformylase [Spirochaetia bacterium]|nr:peptide deformylase [Spirochaetia bacterium]
MLSIVKLGDPVLKKHSVVVPDINDRIQSLIVEMTETMEKGKGVGLAAVQVGELIRLFITKTPGDSVRVFINPDILETSIEQVTMEEGCLSIPGLYTDVTRPASVRVQAWNEKGRPFTLSAEDYLARVIQHEFDHLNGVLFIDRVGPKKKQRLLEEYDSKVGV